MTIRYDELESLERCLNILEGLDKAHDQLDEQFKLATIDGRETLDQSKQYLKYSEMLAETHECIVEELFDLRDRLIGLPAK